MKNDAKSQLTKILGTYDDRVAADERRIIAKRAADAAFPERFAVLREATLRPAIQEFVDVLTGHGHEATAREQEESSSSTGAVSFAAISLRLNPKPFAFKSAETNRSFIEVTFSANRNERKVTVSSTNTIVNSNGSLGKRGEYEIDAMTADVVAEHVLRSLQEALV
jgi:hypothetical protein